MLKISSKIALNTTKGAIVGSRGWNGNNTSTAQVCEKISQGWILMTVRSMVDKSIIDKGSGKVDLRLVK